MARRRRTRRPKGPQPYTYYLGIRAWYVSCHSSYEWKVIDEGDPDGGPFGRPRIRESKSEHHHYLTLMVDLLNPVKKVTGGELSVHSSRRVKLVTDFYPKNIQYEERPQDEGGGVLWSRWDEDHQARHMTGLVRFDDCSFLALIQLLTSGREVVMELTGDEFYRNSASIRSAGWMTPDHPKWREEIEYAVEQSRAHGLK